MDKAGVIIPNANLLFFTSEAYDIHESTRRKETKIQMIASEKSPRVLFQIVLNKLAGLGSMLFKNIHKNQVDGSQSIAI